MCEAGDAGECLKYVEHCCDEGDQKYKCEYHTKACHHSLNTDADTCVTARDVCCADDETIGGCGCNFWSSLCSASPTSWVTKGDYLKTRVIASDSCCMQINTDKINLSYGEIMDSRNNPHCCCDFYALEIDEEYGTGEVLRYFLQDNYKEMVDMCFCQ